MNLNDKRFPIKINDVFNDKSEFIPGGRELLLINLLVMLVIYLEKIHFTFPYRIFPKYFLIRESLLNLQ